MCCIPVILQRQPWDRLSRQLRSMGGPPLCHHTPEQREFPDLIEPKKLNTRKAAKRICCNERETPASWCVIGDSQS